MILKIAGFISLVSFAMIGGITVNEVIGLISAAAAAYAVIVTAKTKAKESIHDKKIESIEQALEIKDKVQQMLEESIVQMKDDLNNERERVDELEKELDEERKKTAAQAKEIEILNKKITQYTLEIQKKEAVIIELKQQALNKA